MRQLFRVECQTQLPLDLKVEGGPAASPKLCSKSLPCVSTGTDPAHLQRYPLEPFH